MEFTVKQGDITEPRADSLVKVAGTSLRMGSGVAGALRRAANGPINDEAMSKGPVELGCASIVILILGTGPPGSSSRRERS